MVESEPLSVASCSECEARYRLERKRPPAQSTDEFAAQCWEFAADCRVALPRLTVADLTPAQDWKRRIIAAAFTHWLNEIGPRFQAHRAETIPSAPNANSQPVVVFTTCVSGLVAVSDVLGPDQSQVISLLHDEFIHSHLKRSDEDFRWHLHAWSYFPSTPDEDFFQRACNTYPLPPGHAYWQHSEGTMWGQMAGRGVDHLWQWDGTQATLLQEAFSMWVA